MWHKCLLGPKAVKEAKHPTDDVMTNISHIFLLKQLRQHKEGLIVVLRMLRLFIITVLQVSFSVRWEEKKNEDCCVIDHPRLLLKVPPSICVEGETKNRGHVAETKNTLL